MAKHVVRIVEDETGEVALEIDVTGRTERQIDKLVDGMSINLDHEHYSVVEVTEEEQS